MLAPDDLRTSDLICIRDYHPLPSNFHPALAYSLQPGIPLRILDKQNLPFLVVSRVRTDNSEEGPFVVDIRTCSLMRLTSSYVKCASRLRPAPSHPEDPLRELTKAWVDSIPPRSNPLPPTDGLPPPPPTH